MYQCLLVIGSKVNLNKLYEITLKFCFFNDTFSETYADVPSLVVVIVT